MTSRERREVRERMLMKAPRCFYCGAGLTARTATIDHLIPLAAGGADESWNMALACKPCNESKGESFDEME